MTNEKILEVMDFYESELTTLRADLHGSPYAMTISDSTISHCLDMLPRMEQFLTDGRKEKVCRWLGFIQGVLWAEGIFSIDELREHNRSDERSDTEQIKDDLEAVFNTEGPTLDQLLEEQEAAIIIDVKEDEDGV